MCNDIQALNINYVFILLRFRDIVNFRAKSSLSIPQPASFHVEFHDDPFGEDW